MVYLNCKPCMQPSDDKVKIIAWPNLFKRLCMTEFFYILIPYNVNKIHTHTNTLRPLGINGPPPLRFHLYAISLIFF